MPIAAPIGSTPTEPRSDTRRAASTAPSGDAEGDHALQHGRLRQIEAEGMRRPVDDDELERRARTPEEGGGGERDLAEAVAPEEGLQWANSRMR